MLWLVLTLVILIYISVFLINYIKKIRIGDGEKTQMIIGNSPMIF